MDPWGWVQNMMHGEAKKPQVVQIEAAHVAKLSARKEALLKVDESYFRLSVSDIWLSHDFDWGSSVFAGVQSLVRIQAGGRPKTVPAVAGPQTFQIDNKDRRGVATRTQFLTQPLPFRGGTIDTQIALLRMPGENYLKSFMNVLGSFSELVAAPPLSTALEVANKVTDGLGAFADLGQAKLHVGLQQSFTGHNTDDELQPGYVAVIRSDGEMVSAQDLWIGTGGDLRTGSQGRQQYTRYDYMLLRYSVSRTRDDWAVIPAIEAPYEAARTQAKLGKLTKAKQLVDAAIEAVMTCDDLVDEQKDNIVKTLREVVAPQTSKRPARAQGARGAGHAEARKARSVSELPTRRSLVALAARRAI